MRVKHGDEYDVTYTLNMDLTGLTDDDVRILARPIGGVTVELAGTITNATGGVITHTLTGALPVGDYEVEVEVTNGDEVFTFPTPQDGSPPYDMLQVVTDLG